MAGIATNKIQKEVIPPTSRCTDLEHGVRQFLTTTLQNRQSRDLHIMSSFCRR
jgi:hypothetical protein